MVAQRQEETTKSGKDLALDLIQKELQRINADIYDIKQKLNASTAQVEALTQRNAALMGEARRIEGALETTPRVTIKETYDEIVNSQRSLLTLRAQAEKLQHEQEVITRFQESMQQIAEMLQRKDESAGESFDAREMIIRVIDAQEEERETLARKMHDGPAHSLTNFILQAEIALKWFEKDPNRAREELTKLKGAANDSFQRVRGFIAELRPMSLGDLGLVPTLKKYLSDINEKSDLRTEFNLIGREQRMAEYLEVLLFRGIVALVTNARDQRNAATVKVNLEISAEMVRVTVEDNGRGFGTGNLKLNADNSATLGLGALQERVNLVGGSLTLENVPSGGTRITIQVHPDFDN